MISLTWSVDLRFLLVQQQKKRSVLVLGSLSDKSILKFIQTLKLLYVLKLSLALRCVYQLEI